MTKPVTPDEVARHLAPEYSDVVNEINDRLMSGCYTASLKRIEPYIDAIIEDYESAGWHVRVVYNYSTPSHLQFSRHPFIDD